MQQMGEISLSHYSLACRVPTQGMPKMFSLVNTVMQMFMPNTAFIINGTNKQERRHTQREM
jgi:hypothetical protein